MNTTITIGQNPKMKTIDLADEKIENAKAYIAGMVYKAASGKGVWQPDWDELDKKLRSLAGRTI